jgi:hypothetical protein
MQPSSTSQPNVTRSGASSDFYRGEVEALQPQRHFVGKLFVLADSYLSGSQEGPASGDDHPASTL